MLEKARRFLNLLRTSEDPTPFADDLLVFFYDLHDNYRIVSSTNHRISAKGFTILSDLIYNLESRPDETMRDDHWKSFCEMILEDIAVGRIEMAKK